MPRELYFVDAEKYVPERWHSKPEMVKDRQAHVPFSVGEFDLFCGVCYLASIMTRMIRQIELHRQEPSFDGHQASNRFDCEKVSYQVRFSGEQPPRFHGDARPFYSGSRTTVIDFQIQNSVSHLVGKRGITTLYP